MLLEFSVGNYRSFREIATLSLLSTPLRGKSPELDSATRSILPDRRRVLRTAVAYGANASGKSNLIRALRTMQVLVVDSARQGQAGDKLPITPFRLSTATVAQPSHFEVVFLEEGIQYRYGFEATSDAVTREWLFHRPKAREAVLFERTGAVVTHSAVFREAEGIASKTRDNALFLSVVAQFNGPMARRVLGWFHNRLRVVIGLNDHPLVQDAFRSTTAQMMVDGEAPASDFPSTRRAHTRAAIESILTGADLDIRGLAVRIEPAERNFPPDMPPDVRRVAMRYGPPEVHDVRTRHDVFDETGARVTTVDFDLEVEESDGTRKLFTLAGPIVDALEHGFVVVIDELDARMHPLLTQAIVALFHDAARNPRDAQLVFASHDIHLLDPDIFRRDQIWFVEKDTTGGSTLVSLAEYRGVRNNAAYRDAYMRGEYRALPRLRQFGSGLVRHE